MNKSVMGTPYRIKSYSPSHSWTLWWRVRWLKQCRLEVAAELQQRWRRMNRQEHTACKKLSDEVLICVWLTACADKRQRSDSTTAELHTGIGRTQRDAVWYNSHVCIRGIDTLSGETNFTVCVCLLQNSQNQEMTWEPTLLDETLSCIIVHYLWNYNARRCNPHESYS